MEGCIHACTLFVCTYIKTESRKMVRKCMYVCIYIYNYTIYKYKHITFIIRYMLYVIYHDHVFYVIYYSEVHRPAAAGRVAERRGATLPQALQARGGS